MVEWLWSGTRRLAERKWSGSLVHERFSEEASEAPQAVAVKDGEREWSYGELEERRTSWGGTCGAREWGRRYALACAWVGEWTWRSGRSGL